MSIALNITAWRTLYPAFSDVTKYPDTTITMNWDTSRLYISANDYGWLSGTSRQRAIDLMCAHLTALSDMIASGNIPAMVNSSTIDKISVTLTPPPVKTHFQWWLSLTPYGQQLLALMNSFSVGGFSVGGRSELSAFRKAGGVF